MIIKNSEDCKKAAVESEIDLETIEKIFNIEDKKQENSINELTKKNLLFIWRKYSDSRADSEAENHALMEMDNWCKSHTHSGIKRDEASILWKLYNISRLNASLESHILNTLLSHAIKTKDISLMWKIYNRSTTAHKIRANAIWEINSLCQRRLFHAIKTKDISLMWKVYRDCQKDSEVEERVLRAIIAEI